MLVPILFQVIVRVDFDYNDYTDSVSFLAKSINMLMKQSNKKTVEITENAYKSIVIDFE